MAKYISQLLPFLAEGRRKYINRIGQEILNSLSSTLTMAMKIAAGDCR
jgi:hypothetical protein